MTKHFAAVAILLFFFVWVPWMVVAAPAPAADEAVHRKGWTAVPDAEYRALARDAAAYRELRSKLAVARDAVLQGVRDAGGDPRTDFVQIGVGVPAEGPADPSYPPR